jgi:hypothetical protein
MRNLTETELKTLQDKRTQAVSSAEIGVHEYWKIYEWLADTLQNKLLPDTDSTVLWLRGAAEANAGRGAMSELIRKYTITQFQLRYGKSPTEEDMQKASDQVAQNLLADLLGEAKNGWPKGQVPDITRIAIADATAVGEILFNTDPEDTAAEKNQNSAWAGSLLLHLSAATKLVD